jgi:SAM-dependent methyltransferase
MSSIVDKHGLLDRVEGARLDLGCGSRKRGSDYIGVDVVDHEAVDVVGDVFDVLDRIPDASLDRIYSSHFMEHIDDVPLLMRAIGRVLKPNGSLETIVPHFSNPYFASDATHRTSFGLYSMSYFAKGSPFKRSVPMYEVQPLFHLHEVRLVFKAPRPFYVRYAFSKFVERFVNLSRSTQEFYEGFGCYWFPCYELKFVMSRLSAPITLGEPATPTDGDRIS